MTTVRSDAVRRSPPADWSAGGDRFQPGECPDGHTTIAQGNPPGSAGRAWKSAAVAIYAVAAAVLVYIARDRINPDAIAYIQTARHYAAGRFDLAVNGWFGPLISWLLLPAVWIGGEPAVWFRIYNAIFGLALAAGTMRLTRRVTGGRWGMLAFVAALLLSLGAVGNELTPDLLLAAAMAWYFCAAHSLLTGGGARRAFAVGLLGGLCYLIKGYALVFIAAHLTMTFLFRFAFSRIDQARTPEATGKQADEDGPRARRGVPFLAKCCAAALAGVILAAAPWAAVLSLRTGHLTISTISQASDALRPNPPPVPLPIHLLQKTTPGRITNWENPAEIPLPWGKWDTKGEWDRLSRIAEAAGLNAKDAGWAILRYDLAGLLAIGWIVGLVTCFLRGRRVSDSAAVRLWLCLTALLYAGGLLSLWVVPRFFWVLWPPLLAVFASVLTLIDRAGTVSPKGWNSSAQGEALGSDAAQDQSPEGATQSACGSNLVSPFQGSSRNSDEYPGLRPGLMNASLSGSGKGWRRLTLILAAMLIVSIVSELARYVFLDESGPINRGREATRLRQLARDCKLEGPIIANKAGPWSENNWYRGLFTTYWAAGPRGDKAQFLGEFGYLFLCWPSLDDGPLFYSVNPWSTIIYDRLQPEAGPFTILVFDNTEMGEYLSSHFGPYLQNRTIVPDDPAHTEALRFQFRPQPATAPHGSP